MIKTFIKWLNVVDQKQDNFNAPWTENEITYFRKAAGKCGLKDPEQRRELIEYFDEMMPENGYNITPEQQNKGIEYLRNKTFKLNGKLRKNNIFGMFELDVIKNYFSFKFVGLHPQKNGIGETLGWLPVYRCISEDGSYFDYTGTVCRMIEVLNIHSTKLKKV